MIVEVLAAVAVGATPAAVLSDQTKGVRLRPAAAPIFGQQSSLFQGNTGGNAATGQLRYAARDLTRRENGGSARLV
jgi:hypothetical protein